MKQKATSYYMVIHSLSHWTCVSVCVCRCMCLFMCVHCYYHYICKTVHQHSARLWFTQEKESDKPPLLTDSLSLSFYPPLPPHIFLFTRLPSTHCTPLSLLPLLIFLVCLGFLRFLLPFAFFSRPPHLWGTHLATWNRDESGACVTFLWFKRPARCYCGTCVHVLRMALVFCVCVFACQCVCMKPHGVLDVCCMFLCTIRH